MKRTLLMALLVAITGCAADKSGTTEKVDDPVETDKSEVLVQKLVAKDSGKTISLKLDQVITVSLDSSPGTGYSWRIKTLDQNVLKSIKTKYRYPNSGRRRMGGSTKKIFTFKAIAKGKTELELIYNRVWEKDKPPIKTFKLTVNVK